MHATCNLNTRLKLQEESRLNYYFKDKKARLGQVQITNKNVDLKSVSPFYWAQFFVTTKNDLSRTQNHIKLANDNDLLRSKT